MLYVLLLATAAAFQPLSDPPVYVDPSGTWMAWIEPHTELRRGGRYCVAPVDEAPATCRAIGESPRAERVGWLGPGLLATGHGEPDTSTTSWYARAAPAFARPPALEGTVGVRSDGRAFRLDLKGNRRVVSTWTGTDWRRLGTVTGGGRHDRVVPLVDRDTVLGSLVRHGDRFGRVGALELFTRRGLSVLRSPSSLADDACDVHGVPVQVSTVPSGGDVFVVDRRVGTTATLSRLHLDRAGASALLGKAPTTRVHAPEVGVPLLPVQSATGVPLAFRHRGVDTEWHLEQAAPLDALLAELGTELRVVQAPRGGPWVVQHQDGARPWRTLLVDPSTGEWRPALAQQELPPDRPIVHRLWHPARDGMDIATYAIQPDPRVHGPGPHPTVVFVHGGPWSSGRSIHTRDFTYAARGYLVVETDFRGSTAYGREYCEAWNGEYSEAMVTDVLDGLQAVRDLGLVGPTAVFGWSYGGWVSAILATQHADGLACGVAVNAPLDVYDTGVWGTLSDEKADQKRAPIRHLGQLGLPLLHIHGDDDDVVDPSSLDEAVRRARRTESSGYAAVEVPGMDHSGERTHSGLVYALTDHWLDRCLHDRETSLADRVDAAGFRVRFDGPGWLQ